MLRAMVHGSSGPAQASRRIAWLALLLFALVVTVVWPWFNAPLNDDWQYTRAAKLLAETGKLTIDTPIAPSIVVQSYLGAAVIRVFGFSHILLRALTVLVAGVGLVCVERTLHYVKVPRPWSFAALVLLVINPIALHVTLTFHSEWYGYICALLAMVLWFRVRSSRFADEPLPPWLYLAAAALAVAAFWSRQFSVLIYPALVASRLLPWFRAGLLRRLPEIGAAALGTVVVAGGVLGYFAWARATGNYKPAFANPVASLTRFSANTWLIQASACLAYMSASFAPLLLLAWRGADPQRRLWLGTACGALMVGGLLSLQVSGGEGYAPAQPLNQRFPYVNNVIYQTGIGPITLSDVYNEQSLARPNWSSSNAWLRIEWVVLLSTVLWGALASRAASPGKGGRAPGSSLVTNQRISEPGRTAERGTGAREELCWFAGALLVGSLILSVQAYQTDVFDRYYFPCILALAVLAPACLANPARSDRPRLGVDTVLAGCSALALAWFTIAGTHDYMRWNQIRLELYDQAVAQGVSPASIDAGWELNGWYNVDSRHAPTCIGACRCQPSTWYCIDNSYRILMSGAPPHYEVVKQVKPAYWLADGPPLSLVRRQARPASPPP